MPLASAEIDLLAAHLPLPSHGSRLEEAVAALEAGRFEQAEWLASAAVRRCPDDLEALLLQGLAIAAAAEPQRAAPLLQRVARAYPGQPHPCRRLAQLRADAPDLVAAQFRACRQLAPNDAPLACAYAEHLLETSRPAPAAAMLRHLLERAPHHVAARNLLGMALIDLGDMEGAIAAFRRATQMAPEQAAIWGNLGMALKIEGRFAECFAAYTRALALCPNDPQLRLNRAVACLRAGDWAQAWPDYECRLQLDGQPRIPMERLMPSLSACPDLAGRTIVVWHEEGFGDTIQFARYVPLLAGRGARVILRVPPQLRRLLGTLEGVAHVTSPPDPLPAFDWHVPFFSLPRVFETTVDRIPAATPYLHADPALAAAWAPRLPSNGLRVGLAWAGQARPWLPGFAAVDARRSLALAALAPLARVPGATFVSLQLGPAAAEAHTPPRGMALLNRAADIADFADTAAIVANLDAIVSVDTSVVHLAGALGKPVLLLDRYDSCWRWLAGRDDSPWYPGLRIFRQPRPGDWQQPIAGVAATLARMAEQAPRN